MQNISSPSAYYTESRARYDRELSIVLRRRNFVTIGKVVTFLIICVELYFAIVDVTGVWYLLILSVAVFVLLTIVDRRIVARIGRLRELVRLCDVESEYLCERFEGLPDGAEFCDPAHPYTQDLDIFGSASLFQRLNRTVTWSGRALLADWLRRPLLTADAIRRRTEATAELAARPDWCLDLRAAAKGRKMEPSDLKFIEQWQQDQPMLSSRTARVVIYAAGVVTCVLWLLATLAVVPYGLPIIMSVGQLAVVAVYLKRINAIHSRLGRFVGTLGSYLELVRSLHEQKFESETLRELHARLFGDANALVALSSLKRTMNSFDGRNNILAALLLNGLYLRDLHVVIALERWRSRYGAHLPTWIDAVSHVEALVSMAVYRFNHPEYITPQISTEGPVVSADGVRHPMLAADGSVANDFAIADLHNLVIITGANMAGKSTFLRTVGVNLLLALTGGVVSASRFECRPTLIFTAMRTTDNLSKGESYFHAELLRLKRLVDLSNAGDPVFVILDEMLKGTNSHDKLNGSLRFLERLVDMPVAGIIATHDLALADLAVSRPAAFRAACFEIDHTQDDIIYDYTLRDGVSQNMNASILLQRMGLI